MTQFTTAKDFADFICTKRYSRSHMMMLNRKHGSERLDVVVSDIIRFSRWDIEDGGIPFEYNQAAYGLRWCLNSGRVNAETTLAIRALNVRQLCMLIHELMMFSYDIGEYAQWLMRRYTPQYFSVA